MTRGGRLDELIVAYLVGEIAEEDLAELDALLRADTAARERFAELTEQDFALRGVLLAEKAGRRAGRGRRGTARLRSRPVLWISAVAAAAAAVIAVGVFIFRDGDTPGRPAAGIAEVATLEGAAEVARGGDRAPLAVGRGILPGDDLTIAADAHVSLALADGGTIDLYGGCRLAFEAAREGTVVRLAAGSIAADVAPQGRGRAMRISTPHATVTIVGTKLSVSAAGDGTRVEVQEGSVRVERTSDARALDVAAGRYVDVNVDGTGFAVRERLAATSGVFHHRIADAGDVAEARFELWIPDEIGPDEPVRGVLCATDFHAGAEIYADPEWREAAVRMRFAVMKHLIGRRTSRPEEQPLALGATAARSLLDALAEFAHRSGRPEIEHAGVVLTGLAIAGYQAVAFSGHVPDRVIAVVADSPYYSNSEHGGAFACDVSKLAAGTSAVPQLHEMAGKRYGFQLARDFVAQARARGALWGLCIQPEVDWYQLGDQDFSRLWLEEVVRLRLPAAIPRVGPYRLRPLRAEDGWLGEFDAEVRPDANGRSSVETTARRAVAVPYDAYRGDRSKAVWLPGERAARAWERHMTGAARGE